MTTYLFSWHMPGLMMRAQDVSMHTTFEEAKAALLEELAIYRDYFQSHKSLVRDADNAIAFAKKQTAPFGVWLDGYHYTIELSN